jgi:hypothetical protein
MGSYDPDHVVVEDQLALEGTVVVETLARLKSEGLNRHDALHAIGSLLAADLFELMQENSETTGGAYLRYLERLRKLTVNNWRAG